MHKRLVVESLDEVMNFQKNRDPFGALGIGRKQLIIDWLNLMDIQDYTINDDHTIDTHVSIIITDKDLVEFPDYIKFGNVAGSFVSSGNSLISLRGCPENVGLYFSCSDNQLTSLEHCPKYVYGSFDCFNNKRDFTEEDIRKLCDVHGNIYLTEF
jgi:hypothetical protein